MNLDDAIQRPFVHAVFLEVLHKMMNTFIVEIRRRPAVHLIGTGNVYDNQTKARFFQSEQMYPFDPAEIRPGKDYSKLVKHLGRELFSELFDELAKYGAKEGSRILTLAADTLNPCWIEEIPSGALKGAWQANVRWTLALPDELPHGLEGPKLIVPPTAGEDPLDLHAQMEQEKRDTDHALKEAQKSAEDLFKIDLDAPTKKD